MCDFIRKFSMIVLNSISLDTCDGWTDLTISTCGVFPSKLTGKDSWAVRINVISS